MSFCLDPSARCLSSTPNPLISPVYFLFPTVTMATQCVHVYGQGMLWICVALFICFIVHSVCIYMKNVCVSAWARACMCKPIFSLCQQLHTPPCRNTSLSAQKGGKNLQHSIYWEEAKERKSRRREKDIITVFFHNKDIWTDRNQRNVWDMFVTSVILYIINCFMDKFLMFCLFTTFLEHFWSGT